MRFAFETSIRRDKARSKLLALQGESTSSSGDCVRTARSLFSRAFEAYATDREGMLRPPLLDASLKLEIIRREPLLVVLPAEHALATQERIVLS